MVEDINIPQKPDPRGGEVIPLADRKKWASAVSRQFKHTVFQRSLLRHLAMKAVKGSLWGKEHSQAALAEEFSVALSTVVRAFKRYRKDGLMVAIPQKHGPNEYVLDYDSQSSVSKLERVIEEPENEQSLITRFEAESVDSSMCQNDTLNEAKCYPQKRVSATNPSDITKVTRETGETPQDDAPKDDEDLMIPAGGQRGERPSLDTPPLDDSETITLKVRPAWREAAALRGIPVEWLVAQYVGRTCAKVLRRAKAPPRPKCTKIGRPLGAIGRGVKASLSDGPLSVDDIRERLPDVASASLQVAISRMLKRGEIVRPSRATYELVAGEIDHGRN